PETTGHCLSPLNFVACHVPIRRTSYRQIFQTLSEGERRLPGKGDLLFITASGKLPGPEKMNRAQRE
ncbi:hypothetical protein, partial [Faecalibaculum rodentium]